MKRTVAFTLMALLLIGIALADSIVIQSKDNNGKGNKADKDAEKLAESTEQLIGDVIIGSEVITSQEDYPSDATPAPINITIGNNLTMNDTDNNQDINISKNKSWENKTAPAHANVTINYTDSNSSDDSSSDNISEDNTDNAREEDSSEIPGDPNDYSDLVYVMFKKDIVGINDTQILRLDAKNVHYGILKVQVALYTPENITKIFELKRVEGDRYYGTWETELSGFIPGTYTIKDVSLYSTDRAPSNWQEKASFYVMSDAKVNKTSLRLVYSTIEKSRVKNSTNVTFRLDAQDYSGIEKVTILVNSTRNDSFSVDLAMIKGDKTYGTWEGEIPVTKPDTTYTVSSVTLYNENKSKTYNLTDRSVYLSAPPYRPPPPNSEARLTPQEWAVAQLSSPFFPTAVGFLLMVIIAIIVGLKRSKPETEN